ncbi:MAG TPA: hypothetical protein VGC77_18555 [Rhodopseudomonas sp.]
MRNELAASFDQGSLTHQRSLTAAVFFFDDAHCARPPTCPGGPFALF